MADNNALTDKQKLLAEAMNRFRMVEDAENDIRNKGLEADRFRVGEQWPTNVKNTRAIESRPCLTFNMMPQFIRQVTNDARMNRPSVKIAPVEDGDVETAKILEGLVRHIQVASNADVAYDTACDSQVTKGWGYFRLVTDYLKDSFDQEIFIKRIKNAFSVYYDPSCSEPDYSDAKYCFIVEDCPRDEFKRQYPKAEISEVNFSSTGDSQPDWERGDFVRIAEYFTVEETDDTLCLMPDGALLYKSDLPEEVHASIQKERPAKRRKLMWRKITAMDILEEREWPGEYIPVIPVLGEDIDVDGKRHLTGMVYNAMDAQRQYNYMRTAETEAIALSPKAPFIAAVGQIENFETIWQRANIDTYSVLPYNPINVDGIAVPPPSRNQAEPPVQAMVMASQQASDDLKKTTGIYDASLGAKSNETSGKAIMARQREGDVANFNYIDNLSRAIRYLGIQLVDLIPKIYDAPRVVRIVGEDQESKTVKINQPSGEKTVDKQGQAIERIYDLTTGKYDVVVEVGPSFSTKRQESVDTMTTMAQAYPPLMQIAGDILVKNMDWPQATEVAERLKKMLPPELQDKPEGEAPIPPQAQQQLQQSQQMIEMLTKALHDAQDKVDGKEMDNASREKITAMNNETKLVIEAMKNEFGAAQALMMEELRQITQQKVMATQAEMEAKQPEEEAETTPLTPPQAM